jgi:hypothetical protein
MISGFRIAFLVMLILSQNCVHAFAPQKLRSTLFRPKTTTRNAIIGNKHMNSVLSLPALGDSLVMLRESSGDGEPSIGLGQSDQGVLGAIGAVAALIVLFSEYTLKTTGCGLPAGPLGLVGLVEGLSYLSVVGIGSFSLCIKVKTVSSYKTGTFVRLCTGYAIQHS